MNPYGQYFEDSDGLVSIEAAMLEEKNEHGLNDMIMHGFAPYEAGIDNKPILYKSVPSGDGFELVTTVNGKPFTRLVSKSKWGGYWQELVVNLSGKDIYLANNEDMAKEIKPLHIRTAFNEPYLEPKKHRVNPYGIALSAYDNTIQASIATFSEINDRDRKDILLLVEGRIAHAEGIDGKVIRYKAVPRSGNGTEYQFSKNGKTISRMIRTSSWGGNAWPIYLDGKSYQLSIDPYKSSQIQPLHLLTAYEQTE